MQVVPFAMEKINEYYGNTSHYYILHPRRRDMQQHYGYAAGLSLDNRPKWTGVFLERSPGAFGRKDFAPIPIDSEAYRGHCERLGPAFAAVMRGDSLPEMGL